MQGDEGLMEGMPPWHSAPCCALQLVSGVQARLAPSMAALLRSVEYREEAWGHMGHGA